MLIKSRYFLQSLIKIKVSFIISLLCSVFFSAQATIIGIDDRIPSSHEGYPASAIGKLIFTKNGSRQFCTAPLISSQVAITSAHCVLNSKDVKISILGRDFPLSSKRIFTTTDFKNNPQASLADYAFIILPQAIGKQAGWFSLIDYDHQEFGQRDIFKLKGFAADISSQDRFFSLQSNCSSIETLEQGIMTHNCDTGPGSSGAPLYRIKKSTNKAYLFGMNTKTSSRKTCRAADRDCVNYAVDSSEIKSAYNKLVSYLKDNI